MNLVQRTGRPPSSNIEAAPRVAQVSVRGLGFRIFGRRDEEFRVKGLFGVLGLRIRAFGLEILGFWGLACDIAKRIFAWIKYPL